jgi:toxin ParE1/3/4
VKAVVIHGAARAELDDAMKFYENRAKGLGLDLQSRVERAVVEIQRNPHAWPPHKHLGVRKYFTERFPFTIFYMDLPDCIWIVAIAHGSRLPDYWSKRRREKDA